MISSQFQQINDKGNLPDQAQSLQTDRSGNSESPEVYSDYPKVQTQIII